MTPSRFRQIEEIFNAASELDPTKRAGFLNSKCPDNALRAEVEALLDGIDRPTEPLGQRLQSAIEDVAGELERDELIGQYCGSWRIEKLLGRGGMGVVYLGVREGEEFKQRAAIKLLLFGAAAGQYSLEKLRAERQILARLEHPNITRLIDGGAYVTPSGVRLPFLAMEYVDGKPLLQYVEEMGLNLAARLTLFQKICRKVQFAHQNLIVHRDLKPGNILVTAEGEPKLLDFGIARLIDPITDAPEQTATRVFTPEYASPEQIRGAPALPASDIYALGGILYELLTGSRPFVFETLNSVEMERKICDTEPARPSTRGGPFTSSLKGDLDNIVLMALRKDPLRRYESARQMADDVGRYLDQLPVIARQDTFFYRSSKLVRRHWVAFTAAALAFITLSVSLGIALREGQLANARFQDVRALANTFMFDFETEISKVPGNTRAREMLAATSQKYLDNLAKSAGNDEGLLADLATSYEKLGDVQGMPGRANLGRTADALESYRKATGILERLAPRNLKYRARLAADLGYSSRILGYLNSAEGLRLAERAAESADLVHAEAPQDRRLLRIIAPVYGLLWTFQQGMYRSEEALQTSRKSLEIQRRLLDDSSPKAAHPLALALNRLASAHRNLANLDDSEGAYRRALEIEEKILAVSPNDERSLAFAGGLHESLGLLEYSERYPSRENLEVSLLQLRQSLEMYSRLADADPNAINTRIDVAWAAAPAALVSLRLGTPESAGAADQLSARAVNVIESVVAKTKISNFLLDRQSGIDAVRALVLAQTGRKEMAVAISRRALEEQRQIPTEGKLTVDMRLDLAGELLRHAEVLVICGQAQPASAAISEADRLAAGLDAELRQFIAMGFQAGAYHFALARAFDKAAMPRDAARHYAEAARFWKPWQESKPYVRQGITEALAAQARCR